MKNYDIDKIEGSNENKYLFITYFQILIKTNVDNIVLFISFIRVLR